MLTLSSFPLQAPELCALYALDVPPSKVRAKIRTWFEANKNIKDLAVLDVLLHKGHVEYQETMNAWKQNPHVMKWFAEEEVSNACVRGGLLFESTPTDTFFPPSHLLLFARQRHPVSAAQTLSTLDYVALTLSALLSRSETGNLPRALLLKSG